MSIKIGQKWQQFFLDKHLDDVVNTGYFTGYSFRQLIDVDNGEEVTFISEYYFNDLWRDSHFGNLGFDCSGDVFWSRVFGGLQRCAEGDGL